MKLTNTHKALTKFGKAVTTKAKKYVYDRKINSSGDLRKSIAYKVDKDGGQLDFYMEAYGILRDAGQLGSKRKILKGWNKSIFLPRGKGFTNKFPPPDAIKKWIRTKPVRWNIPLNTMAFLIARKIRTEGITPGLFFSDAYNEEIKKGEVYIMDAFALDIDNILDDGNNSST